MERKIEKIFSWFLLLAFSLLFVMTWNYGARARMAPLLLLIPGMALAVIQLWRIYRSPGPEDKSAAAEEKQSFEIEAPFNEEMSILAWFAAFAAMIWLLGFLAATPLFLAAFLRFWGKESWFLALTLAVLTDVFIYLVVEAGFRIILYRGWLFSY